MHVRSDLVASSLNIYLGARLDHLHPRLHLRRIHHHQHNARSYARHTAGECSHWRFGSRAHPLGVDSGGETHPTTRPCTNTTPPPPTSMSITYQRSAAHRGHTCQHLTPSTQHPGNPTPQHTPDTPTQSPVTQPRSAIVSAPRSRWATRVRLAENDSKEEEQTVKDLTLEDMFEVRRAL